MSWAAHQFEYYAIQGHLPRRWLGKISFLGIVVGDQTCDLVGKIWSYGVDIGGTHYGPAQPSQWHRGWPGLGVTHSLLWAFAAGGIAYLLTRNGRGLSASGSAPPPTQSLTSATASARCSPSRSVRRRSRTAPGRTRRQPTAGSTSTPPRTTAAGAS